MPSRYAATRKQARDGVWVEYRLGDDDNRARAIICYKRDEDVIHLVGRTVTHDHETMRQLVTRTRLKG